MKTKRPFDHQVSISIFKTELTPRTESAAWTLKNGKLYVNVLSTHRNRIGPIAVVATQLATAIVSALWCRYKGTSRAFLNVCSVVSFLLYAIGLTYAANTTNSSEPLLSTSSPFVLYLQNPPWIEEMLYVQSILNVSLSETGQTTAKGWVNTTNLIAIQPSGMFIRWLNPNPAPYAVPASPTQRLVLAISSDYIWEANLDDRVLSLSSRHPEQGGSEKNSLQRLVSSYMKFGIDPVRFFGFPALRPGSFHLAENSSFVALTADGQRLTGNILSAYDDRPTRLKYVVGENLKNYVLLTYKYNSGKMLPDYFVRIEPHNMTNWILMARFGIDTNIHNGYAPSMLFTNSSVFTQTLIESNGQRYVLAQNGTLKPLGAWQSPHSVPHGYQEHSLITLILILVIFLAGNGYFVWKIARRRKKT